MRPVVKPRANIIVARMSGGVFNETMSDENEIVPLVYNVCRPRSVVHYGCGDGAFLAAFKSAGVEKILGIDHHPDCPRLSAGEYVCASLSKDVRSGSTFDLAVSLEVGEHIPSAASDTFVENLVRLSPVILFSAAVPNQGGKNHINEQWPSYWAEKFARVGYSMHDVIRPVLWSNRNVSVWFRQNMFLVTHADQKDVVGAFKTLIRSPVIDMVHPDLYAEKATRLEGILYGRFGLSIYVRLLLKTVLGKVGLYHKE